MDNVLFHLAFPVTDIAETKAFYVDGLGCKAGREGPNSIILNLYGHQIVAHTTPDPGGGGGGVLAGRLGGGGGGVGVWGGVVGGGGGVGGWGGA
jgi:extradiol dioxygenase family protein